MNQGDCGRDGGEGTDLLVEISQRPRRKKAHFGGNILSSRVRQKERRHGRPTTEALEESPRIRVKPKSEGEALREVRWARSSSELRVMPQDPRPVVRGAALESKARGMVRRGPARVGRSGVLKAGSSRESDRRILRDRPDTSWRRSNQEDEGSLRLC